MKKNNKSKNKEMSKSEIYALLGFFCVFIFGLLNWAGINFIYSILVGSGFFIVSHLLYKKFGNIKMTKLTGTQLFIILVGIPLGIGFIYMMILIAKAIRMILNN